MENKSLMTLIDESKKIESLLIESNGELTPEIESLMCLNYSSIKTKSDSYCVILDRMDREMEYYDSIAKEAKSRYTIIDKTIKSIKDRLKDIMFYNGIDYVQGDTFKITLSNSKPSVIITNEDKIPENFRIRKEVVSIDKTAIAEAINSGLKIDGADIFEGKSLRITMKRG